MGRQFAGPIGKFQLNKIIGYLLVLGAIAIPIIGCHRDDVEVIEPQAASHAFTGSPDAKFAGAWRTENGLSKYTIAGDGTYKLETKIQVRGQKPFISHLSGQWAVSGHQMSFKDQSGNVATYDSELQGNKLTLTSLGTLKSKTVMDR